jgi:hypothetical protein
MRYSQQPIKQNSQGKLVTTIVHYPSIPTSVDDIYIETKRGDRLDNLAYIYYDNPRYAWVLALANNLGKGTYAVPSGIRLRIPADLEDILADFIELNSNP